MANLTGLELLKYDVQMAGFGLPVSLAAGVAYTEAATEGTELPPHAANSTLVPYNPAALNDAPGNAPRAFVHSNNTGLNGSDVLVIKSSVANLNPTSKKWSLITNNGVNPIVKRWGGTISDPVMDFAANDRFIVLDDNYQLLTSGANNWCFTFSNSGEEFTNSSGLAPPLPDPGVQNINYIYGLDSAAGAHAMPFNRVDYYLDSISTDFPSSCAPGTYTLYRSTINQANGALNKTPLIDCVADFQVAFGLDTDLDGNVDTWVGSGGAAALGAMTALQIQQQLREVTAFVVYQEGLGDTGKTADFRFNGTLTVGNPNTTGQLSTFTPAGTQNQYRWKVIEIDMKPMNLIRTQ